MSFVLSDQFTMYVLLYCTQLYCIVFICMLSYVTGLKVRQLCLSDDLVWAITEDDKLMCRVGITSEHIQGECWKQVPGRVISQLTGK